MIDDDYPSDGLVVCFAGSVTHVDPAAGDAGSVIAVADTLQTLVMDELGAGWPEHYQRRKFVGLLTPGLDQVGAPCWLLQGQSLVSLGGLHSLLTSGPEPDA